MRTKYKDLKYTPEIILYFIQNGNEPRTATQVAKAMGKEYPQIQATLKRGTEQNRFKRVPSPVRGPGVYYISLIKTIKEVEDIFDLSIERETRGETTLLSINSKKVEVVDISPLAKNISVDGHPITKWMSSLAEHPESANKARTNALAFAMILAELADIIAKAGAGKDAPLRTQLRLDDTYDKLRELITYFEQTISKLNQLKDNPIIWSQDFCRRSFYNMLDLKFSAGEMQEFADQMWDHYGRLPNE